MADTLQNQLRDLFTRARMPSSPALAARILELAEKPDSTVDQFADLIQIDPALAARLLKMTNSAAFGQRQEVTSIQRAVSLLGINRVRTVSLGFQLVGHLDRLGGCPFDMERFWQHSLLRACLGREFAELVVPACADEAFLIGLMQDCGMVLLVQLLGKSYADLCQNEALSPRSFHAAENRRFPYNHAQAAGALAREWNLPELIVTNVEQHHVEPLLAQTPTDTDRLRCLTYLIGSVSLSKTEHIDTASVLSQFARLHLNLGSDDIGRGLDGAAEAYAEMAGILQSVVPDNLDVTELLSRANDHLTSSVESERHESSQQQAQLESALGHYRERAARDPLTDVLNRGAMNEAIAASVQQARRSGDAITMMFLDLDNFKKLNDTFGHHAGDEVLKGVARTLKGRVTHGGLVGRYGGEEFVLTVIGLTECEARQLADEILIGVRETRFPELALPGPVTCSLGAVWGVPESDMAVASLVQAADELMYQAKRSGKNRCSFRTLGELYDTDLLASDDDSIEACFQAVDKLRAPRGEKRVVPEEFQRTATMLNRNAPKRILNMRKAVRRELITPCRLTALTGVTLEFESEEAYVRNISTGGVGILVARSLQPGQPLEIELSIPGKPTLYLAGLVAFCRHVEGAIHDVGVQLFSHSRQPLLSENPIAAIRNLDWVADALECARHNTTHPTCS